MVNIFIINHLNISRCVSLMWIMLVCVIILGFCHICTHPITHLYHIFGIHFPLFSLYINLIWLHLPNIPPVLQISVATVTSTFLFFYFYLLPISLEFLILIPLALSSFSTTLPTSYNCIIAAVINLSYFFPFFFFFPVSATRAP